MYMHLQSVHDGTRLLLLLPKAVSAVTVSEVTVTEAAVTRGHHLQLSSTLQCLLDAARLLLLGLGLCSTLLLVPLLQNLCVRTLSQ
jgi:hypothetical protein